MIFNLDIAYIVFGALIGGAALAYALSPLWRGSKRKSDDPEQEIALLKNALEVLERDLERGAISSDEAENSRRELARRLLAADAALQDVPVSSMSGSGKTGAITAATAIALLLAAFAVHSWIGQPSFADRPIAKRNMERERLTTRLDQAQAEQAFKAGRPPLPEPDAETRELIGQLAALLRESPDDIEGRRIMVRTQLSLGRPDRAWPVLQELSALVPDSEAAELLPQIGRLMAVSAGGYISAEALGVFERSGADPSSRFFLGLAALQSGDEAGARDALRIWRSLYVAYQDAPSATTVRSQIYDLSASLRVTPEAIASRIGGALTVSIEASLVAERAILEVEPTNFPRWSRLVKRLRALGRPDAAREAGRRAVILTERNPAAMSTLGAALSEPLIPNSGI